MVSVRSRSKKPLAINLKFHPVSQVLEILEAQHEQVATNIAAKGSWPMGVQVDARPFELFLRKIAEDQLLVLEATASYLVIRANGSKFSLRRIDGTESEVAAVPFPIQDHKGKVVVQDAPHQKRVELSDTWAFSARVPMPQHRDKK